jgi:hypothetical protein
MGKLADQIYTRSSDIARLERIVEALPSTVRVRLTLSDGKVVIGSVTERPNVQVFEDIHGQEGINGIVRLDNPEHYLWLGDIEKVERLDLH